MEQVEVPVCDNAEKWADLPHDGVKSRKFATGWNGFEYAYEDFVVMCDECWEAACDTQWPL